MPTLLEEYKTRMLEDKSPTSIVIEKLLELWKVNDRNSEQERECEKLVGILHCRADEQTMAAARKFLGSNDPSERSLGARILAQVKIGDESKAPLAAELLLCSINEESNTEVLRDLIFAL